MKFSPIYPHTQKPEHSGWYCAETRKDGFTQLEGAHKAAISGLGVSEPFEGWYLFWWFDIDLQTWRAKKNGYTCACQARDWFGQIKEV